MPRLWRFLMHAKKNPRNEGFLKQIYYAARNKAYGEEDQTHSLRMDTSLLAASTKHEDTKYIFPIFLIVNFRNDKLMNSHRLSTVLMVYGPPQDTNRTGRVEGSACAELGHVPGGLFRGYPFFLYHVYHLPGKVVGYQAMTA